MKAPTQGEIDALKRKHGKLFQVDVEPDGDAPALIFLFREPDRKTMSATVKISQTDPLQAAEIMVKNCLVWGDAKELDNMAVFTAVSAQFEEINKARTATIKNL